MYSTWSSVAEAWDPHLAKDLSWSATPVASIVFHPASRTRSIISNMSWSSDIYYGSSCSGGAWLFGVSLILCLQTPLLVQKSFRPVSLVCLRVSFCPYRIYRVSARTCRRTKSGSLTSDIHLDQGKNIHKPQGAWCRNCFQEHFSLNTAANLCQTVWHITDHFHACRFLHNPSSFTFDTPITLHLRTRQSDATLSTWTWVDQEQGISDDFCIYSILLVCNKLNWHSFTYRSFGQFKHNLSVLASI